jgi:protein-tyrosine phosphatase
MDRRMLFLCTGNYYRSRFAELLFNHLAVEAAPGWSAFSRALAIELGTWNEGAISVHTRNACGVRGIVIPEPISFPRSAEAEDFAVATRVIALKEAEHRGSMERRFPRWANRVEYWHVHDLDAGAPDDACAQIEKHVRGLMDELGGVR